VDKPSARGMTIAWLWTEKRILKKRREALARGSAAAVEIHSPPHTRGSPEGKPQGGSGSGNRVRATALVRWGSQTDRSQLRNRQVSVVSGERSAPASHTCRGRTCFATAIPYVIQVVPQCVRPAAARRKDESPKTDAIRCPASSLRRIKKNLEKCFPSLLRGPCAWE
jgi:hypothetical protein